MFPSRQGRAPRTPEGEERSDPKTRSVRGARADCVDVVYPGAAVGRGDRSLRHDDSARYAPDHGVDG